MAESAAARYAAMVRAAEENQRRGAPDRSRVSESGPQTSAPDRWQGCAARFREDPFREDPTLAALLSFIEPEDTVLDVGGGAGRYLPIARQCREYVNVEPSSAMGAQFEASVREAGIGNARWLQSDWQSAQAAGDVCFCANVVYYIEDIAPFVQKLHTASRRRVMIVMHSTPPRNRDAELAGVIHDGEPVHDPGYRELLPVLWELGLLPDVRVLGKSDFIAERERYPDRAAAVSAVIPARLEAAAANRARQAIEDRFLDLFVPAEEGGYRRRPAQDSRVLLITWETRPD
jgi:hypothetical protein